MPPARKFDHGEARRRREAGEGLRTIARSYGVSDQAVLQAVRETPCPICGEFHYVTTKAKTRRCQACRERDLISYQGIRLLRLAVEPSDARALAWKAGVPKVDNVRKILSSLVSGNYLARTETETPILYYRTEKGEDYLAALDTK